MCRIIFKVLRNVFILENIKTIISGGYFATAKTVVTGDIQEKVRDALALQQLLSRIIKRLFRSIPSGTNHKLSPPATFRLNRIVSPDRFGSGHRRKEIFD